MNDPIPSPQTEAHVPGTLQLPLADTGLTADAGGDFSLPDYQPEIKRLLRIRTDCQPPVRSCGGTAVDLTGTVDFFVLYVGNDDKLYCAPLSSEYRLTVPCDRHDAESDLSEPLVCLCDVLPEAATGRVTAPRRLSIRCRLKANVKVFGEKDLRCAEEGGLAPESTERLEGQAEVGRVIQATSAPVEVQDDVILTPGAGEVRVVCASGQVMVTEATAGSDVIHCRGEIVVKLTLCPAEPLAPPDAVSPETGGEDPLPTVLLRKIPFAQTTEAVGVTPDGDCCAFGVCSSLSVRVEEGHLHIDAGVVTEAVAQRNERVTYTRDLYSTCTSGDGRYATYTAHRALRCLNGNFTLSDSQALSEAGIDPTAEVVDVVATAFPEALTCERGRYVLSGSCRCHLLLSRRGEYGSAELTFPFRYETDAAGTDVPLFDGHVTVVQCRARMDGERVGIDAELAVCLRMTAPHALTALSSFTPGAELPRRRGEYVICFPAPTDTLWSVAGRYHAPLAALAAANALPPSDTPNAPETLAGVKYLIV